MSDFAASTVAVRLRLLAMSLPALPRYAGANARSNPDRRLVKPAETNADDDDRIL